MAAHLARGAGGGASASGISALLDPGRTLAWRPGDPRGPVPLTDMFPRNEFFVNNGLDGTWEPEERPGRRGAARQAATAGR